MSAISNKCLYIYWSLYNGITFAGSSRKEYDTQEMEIKFNILSLKLGLSALLFLQFICENLISELIIMYNGLDLLL